MAGEPGLRRLPRLRAARGHLPLPEEHAVALAPRTRPALPGRRVPGGGGARERRALRSPTPSAAGGRGSPSAYAVQICPEATSRPRRPAGEASPARRWLDPGARVAARLEAGAAMADVGCGHGAACCARRAFPRSRFAGYDPQAPPSRRRGGAPARRGLPGRVRFEALPAMAPSRRGLRPGACFESLHEMAHPGPRWPGASTRRSLPDGAWSLVEPFAADRLEGDPGPGAARLLDGGAPLPSRVPGRRRGARAGAPRRRGGRLAESLPGGLRATVRRAAGRARSRSCSKRARRSCRPRGLAVRRASSCLPRPGLARARLPQGRSRAAARSTRSWSCVIALSRAAGVLQQGTTGRSRATRSRWAARVPTPGLPTELGAWTPAGASGDSTLLLDARVESILALLARAAPAQLPDEGREPALAFLLERAEEPRAPVAKARARPRAAAGPLGSALLAAAAARDRRRRRRTRAARLPGLLVAGERPRPVRTGRRAIAEHPARGPPWSALGHASSSGPPTRSAAATRVILASQALWILLSRPDLPELAPWPAVFWC